MNTAVPTIQLPALSYENGRRVFAERAKQFVKRWEGTTSEKQSAQSFCRHLLVEVLDLPDDEVKFEHKVFPPDGSTKWVDVFTRHAVIEMKSAGEDLDLAEKQGRRYLSWLPKGTVPPVLIVCDFARIRVIDVLTGDTEEFPLTDLPTRFDVFHRVFVAPHAKRVATVQGEANAKAVAVMGRLYDLMTAAHHDTHTVSVFLTRLLFLLFGDATDMWKRGVFRELVLEQKDSPEALSATLRVLFETLNTPREERHSAPELVDEFPYVNGGVFAEEGKFILLTEAMRDAIVEAVGYRWGHITPALFGSVFQTVRSKEERRALGQHYTTEETIFLRVMNPLIFDELVAAVRDGWDNRRALVKVQERIASLVFFDPACGSANFLITSYLRLRQMEVEVLGRIADLGGWHDGADIPRVRLENFRGLEYDEWSVEVARVALLLTHHQANLLAEGTQAEDLHDFFPISENPVIVQGDALTVDWSDVVQGGEHLVICGNPPFLGLRRLGDEQREALRALTKGLGTKNLNYVAGWFITAGQLVGEKGGRFGFISASGITQGTQADPLETVLTGAGVHLTFASEPFRWANEAGGQAGTEVVSLLFSPTRPDTVKLMSSDGSNVRTVEQASLSLRSGDGFSVSDRNDQLNSSMPPMKQGSMALDGGHLTKVSDETRQELIRVGDGAVAFLRRYHNATTLTRGGEAMWCLMLDGATPNDLSSSPFIKQKTRAVREWREQAGKQARELAGTPHLFFRSTSPRGAWVGIPKTSTPNRTHFPLFINDGDGSVITNAVLFVETDDRVMAGWLGSRAWRIWAERVSGKLGAAIQVSNKVAYNNFPFPDLTDEQAEELRTTGGQIEQVINSFPDTALEVLYDPATMPSELRQALAANDAVVEKLLSGAALSPSASEDEVWELVVQAHRSMTGV